MEYKPSKEFTISNGYNTGARDVWHLLHHRLLSIYGIGNGITCAIVPHSNAPETLSRILSARKDLVKGHLSRTFD